MLVLTELDPQVGKSFCKRETASFCSRLTPILQDKKQTETIIIKTFCLKSMLFCPESRSDECHFLSLELSTLCYALRNAIVPYTNQVLPEQLTPLTRNRVKLLQSPYFFRPLTPTLLTPSPLPTGILYSPQFACIKRPRWPPVGLNDRHPRSHGKIGDCEQSNGWVKPCKSKGLNCPFLCFSGQDSRNGASWRKHRLVQI